MCKQLVSLRKLRGKTQLPSSNNGYLTLLERLFLPHVFCITGAGVPAHPLPPGAPPRPFLFTMLNYKDRNIILSKARTMGPAMVIAISKISLFPDFLADVQKRRAQFTDVKKNELAVKREVHSFEKPSLAQQCLDCKEYTLREYAANHCLPT